jgi:hypothetical protein
VEKIIYGGKMPGIRSQESGASGQPLDCARGPAVSNQESEIREDIPIPDREGGVVKRGEECPSTPFENQRVKGEKKNK